MIPNHTKHLKKNSRKCTNEEKEQCPEILIYADNGFSRNGAKSFLTSFLTFISYSAILSMRLINENLKQ